jgi:hypothetical protein
MKLRLAALWLALGFASAARANPRPLPMTYQAETSAQGEWEIEQYVDLVPLEALSVTTGAPTDYLGMQLQTEIEYGLTSRLELGLYVTLAPTPGEGFQSTARLPVGNGFKQRLRYRLSDPGAWPVDVALYGELVETQTEFEIEAKIILQRRFGPARAIVNLSAERELYYAGRREWVLNPSGGVSVELSPRWHVGAEGWMWAEHPSPGSGPRPFDLGPHVYAGPAVLISLDRFWWSAGVYLRTTDHGHDLAPGEAFGPVWVRSVFAVAL